MDPRIKGILEFLEKHQIRATYKAVGEAIGVPARTVGTMLGKRNLKASWIVSTRTGKPTRYKPEEEHPALYKNPEIIQTGADLIRRKARSEGRSVILKRLNRHTLFRLCLLVLVAVLVTLLIVAYRQQQEAPLTLKMIFPGTRKEHLRYAQLVLMGQQAHEPLFDGQLFIGLEDTPLEADHLTVYRASCGNYARLRTRMPLIREDDWLHTDAASMQFPAADLGHSRFPFDSSQLDLVFTFEPVIPIEAVFVTNRVPGFVLVHPAVTDRNPDGYPDGSLRIKFFLKRNPFTQIFCGLILVAGFVFASLILATETLSALGSSVAAFFFSLWSLRGVLASQIQTFPTLFDYAIFLLCCFMLAGLIWRVAIHPELKTPG